MACTMSSSLAMSSLASSKSALSGASLPSSRVAVVAAAPVNRLVVKASSDSSEAVSRRVALALVAGVVAAGSRIAPANAAYGESGESQFPSLIKLWNFEIAVGSDRV